MTSSFLNDFIHNPDPNTYSVTMGKDHQIKINKRTEEGSMHGRKVSDRPIFLESVHQAGELVLANLKRNPRDPLMQACAHLLLDENKENDNELLGSKLAERLQTILESIYPTVPQETTPVETSPTSPDSPRFFTSTARSQEEEEEDTQGDTSPRAKKIEVPDSPTSPTSPKTKEMEVPTSPISPTTPKRAVVSSTEREEIQIKAGMIRDQFRGATGVFVRPCPNMQEEIDRIEQSMKGEKLDHPVVTASIIKQNIPFGAPLKDTTETPSRIGLLLNSDGIEILGFQAYPVNSEDPPAHLTYQQKLSYYPNHFPEHNSQAIKRKIRDKDEGFIRKFLGLSEDIPITKEERKQARALLKLLNNRAKNSIKLEKMRSDHSPKGEDLSEQISQLQDAIRQADEAFARLPFAFKAAYSKQEVNRAIASATEEVGPGEVLYNEFRMNYATKDLLGIIVNPDNETSVENGGVFQRELRMMGIEVPIAILANPGQSADLQVFANIDDLRKKRELPGKQ